jgi:indolepyruvate ferredoxin oxidoreductase alpha subunit
MHKLLTDNPGEKMLLLGNEAIARGAIEAGVAFTSTYPGTPSSEITLNFFQMSQECDLYFEYSTNEKVALEVSAAAANCGVRSMAVMKHVGLNVAADEAMESVLHFFAPEVAGTTNPETRQYAGGRFFRPGVGESVAKRR